MGPGHVRGCMASPVSNHALSVGVLGGKQKGDKVVQEEALYCTVAV